MHIIELPNNNKDLIDQAARLLVEGFELAWPTMEEGLEEMASVLQPGKIVRAAIEEDAVLGWVGANNDSYEQKSLSKRVGTCRPYQKFEPTSV